MKTVKYSTFDQSDVSTSLCCELSDWFKEEQSLEEYGHIGWNNRLFIEKGKENLPEVKEILELIGTPVNEIMTQDEFKQVVGEYQGSDPQRYNEYSLAYLFYNNNSFTLKGINFVGIETPDFFFEDHDEEFEETRGV